MVEAEHDLKATMILPPGKPPHGCRNRQEVQNQAYDATRTSPSYTKHTDANNTKKRFDNGIGALR